MITENQGIESVSGEDFAHQKIFERTKADFPLKSSKPNDFKQLIQNIDCEIHCFDKVVAFSLVSNESLSATKQANTSQPAHPPGPIIEGSHSQPTKSTPFSDLSNMDMDRMHSKAHSEGKWVRIQRPAHLKKNQSSYVSLGKCNSLNHLESSIPTKRRARVGIVHVENCPPTAEADLQPCRER